MSLKKNFQLFTVVVGLIVFGLQPLSAQDLFNFPDDDPIAGEEQPADENRGAADLLSGEQDPADVVPQQDRDPLLDDDDDFLVRPAQPRTRRDDFQFPADEDETPGQTVIMNTKFAGWEQAGPAAPGAGGRRLSKELRANWIMVNSNGRFTGQVVPQADASLEDMVVYLMNSGRQVRETKVDANGFFEFSNVPEGSYALLGLGVNGFFAFGMNIIEFNEQYISKVRNSVRVAAFQNKTTINTDWVQFYAPKVSFRIFGRYREAEGLDDSFSLYGVAGLSANLPDAKPATSIDSSPVIRTASGGMLGRVHQLNSISGRPIDVRATRVLLLKGDEVVTATDTDNYGVFYFPMVEVGQYGLLATGVDGVGLIGIDVIDGDEVKISMNEVGELVDSNNVPQPQEPFPFDFCMISAETVGWLNHYATELAYRRNLLSPRRPSPDEQNQLCRGCEGSGCNHCQGTGLCTSRSQSFEDWAANCLHQHERTRLGSGYILSEASKDLRRIVNRSDDYFEKAFYGDQSGGLGAGSGFPDGGDAGAGLQYGGSGGQIGAGGGGYYNGGNFNPNSPGGR